ncbi:MAG: helix-hairpin-helix domain-containing protein, partial [Candidatus Binatia bacterium]
MATITYQNPENRYTVARLEIDGAQEITVVGEIFPIGEGEEVRFWGAWKTHPRYGVQFHADQWEKIEPTTLEGIERYLGSGSIKGIGPAFAQRLVAAFGLDTLKVLSESPHRIREVAGIGKVRAQRILQAWDEQTGMREVMIFLQGHGVSSSLALKVYRHFGAQAVSMVRENPYRLAQEVHGIGFILADRIATSVGLRRDSPLRMQAGVLYLLEKFSEEGHCFVPLVLVMVKASSLMAIDEEVIQDTVNRLAANGQLSLERVQGDASARLYPQRLYQAERRVASALSQLLSTPSGLRVQGFKDSRDPEPGVALLNLELLNSSNFPLEEEQREAVLQALRRKVLIITGGPGTGKT